VLRGVLVQGLRIRVDGDKLDILDAFADHVVDRVATAAADADDANLGFFVGSAVE
jgi:hypothetical protein